jgi:hypothetical protein
VRFSETADNLGVQGVMMRKSIISGTDFSTYRSAFNSRVELPTKIVFAEVVEKFSPLIKTEGLLMSSQETVVWFFVLDDFGAYSYTFSDSNRYSNISPPFCFSGLGGTYVTRPA